MEVEVYADLLFLINAGMDGLCLALAARLLHRRLRVGRWLLGAALGGVYAVLALLMNVGSGWALAMDILVCLLLCAVVFGRRDGRGVRGLLGAALLFTALSMVMGGVMTALFNLCNRAGLAEVLPGESEGIGAWLFLVFSLVGSVISLSGGRLCRRSAAVRLCEVTLTVEGRSATLRGLSDSGNLLRDPLGGQAVICITREAAERALGAPWADFLRTGGQDLSTADESVLRRIRLIPAGTATGEGLLPGFRPDRVILTPEGGRAREVDAVVAVMSPPIAGTRSPRASTLGGTDAFGVLEALVPSELL